MAWTDSKGHIFAVRHADPHPGPDHPRGPVGYLRFIFATFHGDCFNNKVAEEFIKQVDIAKYKAVSLFQFSSKISCI